MASDEESEVETLQIRLLIMQVQQLLKRPQLNNDLSRTLDAFIQQLTVNNHYLRNGIFTMKFAEFGIFLQDTVELYSKQVDLLWEDTLNYHVKLCSYNQSQNATEAEIITERINRNRRKKILQEIIQNSVLSQNLLEDLERSSKLLTICETITESDVLKNAWKEANNDEPVHSTENDDTNYSETLTDFQFFTHQNVELLTGEKLGNYDDLFLNRITSYTGCFDVELQNSVEHRNEDFLLQRYLKHKGINCKKFYLNKLGEEFNTFKKRIQQIDAILPEEAIKIGISSSFIVNLTPLPQELMLENSSENNERLRAIINDLLLKERQCFANRIKKSSERISDADSAFQDEICTNPGSERNTPTYNSQQSNVDSGIFENDLMDTIPVAASADSNFGDSESENVNKYPLETDEDIFDENINADDIPPYSIDNSVSDGVNVDLVPSVGSPLNNNAMDCSFDTLVESTVGSKKDNVSSRPDPVNVTVYTTLKPLPQQREEPKGRAQKRKLKLDADDDSFPVKQKRAPKFKWLKTTTATLKKFERFFLQHYIPEEDEVDPNNEPDFEDISEDEYEDGGNSVAYEEVHNVIEECPDELQEVTVLEEMPPADLNTVSALLISNSISESMTHTSLNACEDNASLTHNQGVPVNEVEIETTDRIRAVNDWRNFIEPKLKSMNKSSEFDIHEYGSQIMDAIPEGQGLPFKDMVAGKQSSDVCKLFLASLQLANTSNIEIISPEQGQLANETLVFKLLTRERYHEHLDDYEAPSENAFRERLERVKASCPSELIHSTPRLSKGRSRIH